MYSAKRRRIYAKNQINHLEVFKHHNWICVICRTKIDPDKRFPDEAAATLEHLIPLSRGGTHTWENVAPAHGSCNFEKGNKLLEEYHGT